MGRRNSSPAHCPLRMHFYLAAINSSTWLKSRQGVVKASVENDRGYYVTVEFDE